MSSRLCPDEAQANSARFGRAKAAVKLSLPDGLAWIGRESNALNIAVSCQCQTVLYTLYMAQLLGTGIIRFWDGDQWGGIAAKDLAANSIALIPFGEISENRPPANSAGAGTPLILEVQGGG